MASTKNLLLAGLVLGLVVSGRTIECAERAASIIDREGNRTEATSLRYEGQQSLPVMVEGVRSLVKFKEIRDIEFQGGPNEEIQPVVLGLLDGRVLNGEVVTGSSGRVSGGAGSVSSQMSLTGNTRLGRFRLPLSLVKKVIFQPSSPMARCPVDGRLFQQEGYKFCPYDGTPLQPSEPSSPVAPMK